MKPWKLIAQARSPSGGTLVLHERDGEFVIRVDGVALMGSRTHGSEQALAEPLREGSARRVLVGGLGLGYTLRAVLDVLPPEAQVQVAELSEAVVTWNRGPLAALAGAPLKDRRVSVSVEDVRDALARERESLDAVLLDVDNGPRALAAAGNQRLYDREGLALARRALRSGGRLIVWSAGPDRSFVERLSEAGFAASTQAARGRGGEGGARHTLFVGVAAS